MESYINSFAGSEQELLVITRLAPRRLVRYIDLEKLNFRWLSTFDDEHAIEPSLEHLSHLLHQTLEVGTGTIWFDGLEYLAGRQGFHAAHSFVRNLVDAINGSEWSMLIVLAEGTLDSTQVAQICREAPELHIEVEVAHVLDKSLATDEDLDPSTELDLEESTPKESYDSIQEGLVHLTRLGRAGFTRKALRERITRWRAMGLDVSLLEPAMHFDNEEKAYQLYLDIEEKVRRAVDIDTRLGLVADIGESARAHGFRFRIRQLTGLDEIERIIDNLLGSTA